jgi:glyoxylase-like metal-dependent hydrolase (beta-lactamase superfamily II)
MEPYQRYQPTHHALHERNFPHRLIDDIWMWSVFSEEKEIDFNGYLVQLDEGRAFLVDPPCAGPEVLESFQPLPAPQFIVLTNRDHERCAQAFKDAFRIPVYAPENDAPLMSIAVDRVFRDGDMLPGGWQVIHLENQKSPGESALYSLEKRILILGDALVGKPFQCLSMLPGDKYADKNLAREGLKRLQGQDVKAVLPGDGDPVMLNAASLIQEAIVSS